MTKLLIIFGYGGGGGGRRASSLHSLARLSNGRTAGGYSSSSRWLIPKEIIEDASPRFHVRIQIGPLQPRCGMEGGGEREGER